MSKLAYTPAAMRHVFQFVQVNTWLNEVITS